MGRCVAWSLERARCCVLLGSSVCAPDRSAVMNHTSLHLPLVPRLALMVGRSSSPAAHACLPTARTPPCAADVSENEVAGRRSDQRHLREPSRREHHTSVSWRVLGRCAPPWPARAWMDLAP